MATLTSRSSVAVLATLTGTAFLAGCQRFGQQVGDLIPGGAPAPEEQIAELALLPADVPMFLSITSNPEQYVERAPELFQADLREALDETYAEMIEMTGINFEEDVAAWMGEQLTFAIFSLDVDPDPDLETPGFIVATTTSDPALSSAFVQGAWSEMEADGVVFESSTTDGVTLTVQTDAPTGEGLITAEIDDQFVLFANDMAAVEQALAVYQAGNGISTLDTFQTTLDLANQGDPLLWAYINPSFYADEEFLATLEELEGMPSPVLPPESLATLEAMRSIVVSIGWEDQDVRMQMMIDVDPEQLPLDDVQLAAGELIKELPSTALMVITSSGIGSSWEQSLASAQEMDPEFEEILNDIRAEVLAETGLDLDKDILGWMDGEMGVVVLPDAEATNPFASNMGALIAIETSDRQTAENTFAVLDELATEYGIRVSESGDQTIWGDPFLGQPMVVRAWQDDTVLLTSSPALQAAFGVDPSLVEAGPLQAVYEGLPGNNAGYFMINLAGVIATAEELVPPAMLATADIDEETLAMLRSLGGLGISAYEADDTHIGLDILLTTQAPAAPAE
ncbi:MAG: DUF3352 domain-containing protein [Synechococcaceae cyanobacterium SM2_3_2]|nr:DUF3352 domain-containing protein [Synechococcaceae cyanobacterium SM2_3_2]